MAKPQRSPIAWTPASRRRIVAERRLAAEDAQEVQEWLLDAASQLADDSAAARLIAVHALARFADENPVYRQACINVLCASVRAVPAPHPDADDRERSGERWRAWRGDRACRHAVLSVIAAHLRAEAAISWRGCEFDFSGVVFEGSEPPAEPAGGTPGFTGAGLVGAKVSFAGAEFAGGKVSFCSRFTGGSVAFLGSRFTGGAVGFIDAQFTGGEVDFLDAEFTGGEVSFVGAVFAGSEVSFVGAEFAGAIVSFVGAKFALGMVSFVGAEFSGGAVRFPWAEFSGSEVRFAGANFDGGQVDFAQAKFGGGEVDFTSVHFSRGMVDLSGAIVTSAPPSFDDWTTSPACLQLPARYKLT